MSAEPKNTSGELSSATTTATKKKSKKSKNKPKTPSTDNASASTAEETTSSVAATAPANKPKKTRNTRPQAPSTENASATDAAPPHPPLFPTVQSSRTGVERVDFGTNDTLTMLQPIPSAVVTEQLDTVLSAVRQLDNTCCHPAGCRTKVSLIYLECAHCQRRFCMRHGLPEIHGCGEAIRRAERAEFLRPVPLKTRQREEDTRKARERMEQKLKDMQLERRAKPAGGGSGGGSGQKKKK